MTSSTWDASNSKDIAAAKHKPEDAQVLEVTEVTEEDEGEEQSEEVGYPVGVWGGGGGKHI